MRRRQFLGAGAALTQLWNISSSHAQIEIIKTLQDKENYYQDVYGAYASPWAAALEPVPLMHSRDYEDLIKVDPKRFPGGTEISWRWPDNPPKQAGVYGYMHVYRGNYDGGRPPVSSKPVQVTNLRHFRQKVAFTLNEGDPEGFNLLNEFWLTGKAGEPSAKLLEIGFMLHTNDRTEYTVSRSKEILKFRDPQHRDWLMVSAGGAVPFIILMPRDRSDVEGEVDVKDVRDKLVQLSVITGNEWINGIALGVEPHFGSGRLTIDDWHADFH